MKAMNETDKNKLKEIDKMFETMNIADIKEFIGEQQLVDKLKGTDNTGDGILLSLYMENHMLRNDVSSLMTSSSALRYDFQRLLRIMNQGQQIMYNSGEFQSLKNNNGVY